MTVSIRCSDFVAARHWLRLAHPGIDIRIESRVVATRFGVGGRQPVRQYRVYGSTDTLPTIPTPPSLTPIYTV